MSGIDSPPDQSHWESADPMPEHLRHLGTSFRDSVSGVPGAASFQDRWRFLQSHLPGSSRMFRHEVDIRDRPILLGRPVQFWSSFSSSYRPEISVHAVEITRSPGLGRLPLALRIFCYRPGRGGGGRAVDLVLLEHLSWTCDNRTCCVVFRGTGRTEARFPNRTFSLRHLPRGSRLLYVLSPDIEQDQEPGGGVFDPSCVGQPSTLCRLRILFSVARTRRGRQESRPGDAVGPAR